MREPRGQPSLANKALTRERLGDFVAKDLDGDVPIMTEIAREVHGRHAATTELALDIVSVGELSDAHWGNRGRESRRG
jgi:hypothetical protein